MAGPLDGFRVVELAEAVAGPYAAMELGDAGADVIKVEALTGDRTRQWGSHARGDHGAAFFSLNRNKRGIALDLATPRAAAVTSRLLRDADVAIVDAGWAEQASLTDQALMAANPDLVYCVMSEFGDRGPWAGRPPYGELPAQMAAEATTSLGRLDEPPLRMGTDMASMYAAVYAVQGICAALLKRARGGAGQRIDVSLFGSVLAMRSTLWVALSNPDFWSGFHLDSYVKPPDYGYQCKDQAILFSLARVPAESREALYRDLNMGWVVDHPLYESLAGDRAGGASPQGDAVRHLWERAFSAFTASEVIETTRRHGGWAFPMNDYETLVASGQVQHTAMVQEIDQPGAGRIRTLLPPWEFSDTPAEIRLPAPQLGEHSRDVLRQIGYGTAEIESLIRDRAVVG